MIATRDVNSNGKTSAFLLIVLALKCLFVSNLLTMRTPKKTKKKAVNALGPKSDRSALSDQENREALAGVLRHWFVADSDNQIKGIRTNEKIVELLRKEGITRYNGPSQRAVLITPYDLSEIKNEALKKIGATILIGRGSEATFGPFKKRKAALKRIYNLQELCVPAPDESTPGNVFHLYREAANCFEALIDNHSGAPPVVGIGGGQTIFEMTWHISPPERDFVVTALNYATRASDEDMHDSTYLASAVKRLCRKSRAHVLSLPPLHSDKPEAAAQWHSMLYGMNADIRRHFRKTLEPDIVFVGTGNFYAESPSITRFYEPLRITFETLQRFRPVGDINLNFFDGDGIDVTPQVLQGHLEQTCPALLKKMSRGSFFKHENHSHPFLLGLNVERLKDLVRRGKKVVVVAGGDRGKTESIHTLLKHKIANGLVTDVLTMDRLLNLNEREGQAC